MKQFKQIITLNTRGNNTEATLTSAFRSLFGAALVSVDVKTLVCDDRAHYPKSGVSSIRVAKVKFKTKVSKDRAEEIAEYWAKIRYVGEFTRVDWANGEMLIYVDVSKSSSSHPENYNILDLLITFFEEGTPLRKDSTRAVNGLGNDTVESVFGLAV